MRILGAVIAGGQSTRMGQDKALLVLDGVPLVERVLSRLRIQVDAVIISGNGDGARFPKGIDVVADRLSGPGTPLAGLEAVLAHGHAAGFDAVVTVPTDTPFLPLDLVRRLAEGGHDTGAAIARSGGQDHYLTGIWTTAMAPAVSRMVAQGELVRMRDMAVRAAAAQVAWPALPHDPFFNINTPDDLAEATRMLREVA